MVGLSGNTYQSRPAPDVCRFFLMRWFRRRCHCKTHNKVFCLLLLDTLRTSKGVLPRSCCRTGATSRFDLLNSCQCYRKVLQHGRYVQQSVLLLVLVLWDDRSMFGLYIRCDRRNTHPCNTQRSAFPSVCSASNWEGSVAHHYHLHEDLRRRHCHLPVYCLHSQGWPSDTALDVF